MGSPLLRQGEDEFILEIEDDDPTTVVLRTINTYSTVINFGRFLLNHAAFLKIIA